MDNDKHNKILVYLKEHPLSTAREIAAGLGNVSDARSVASILRHYSHGSDAKYEVVSFSEKRGGQIWRACP